MKRAIILLLIISMSITTFAQRPYNQLTAAEKAEKMVKVLEKEINFTDEVKNNIFTILENFYLTVKEYRKEQNFSEMKEAKKERDEKIKMLLSEGDYQKYLIMMEQNKPKGGNRRN